MSRKIKPNSIYQIKLSGHQIKLMQTAITQVKVHDCFNEKAELQADVLYDSLENDSELLE